MLDTLKGVQQKYIHPCLYSPYTLRIFSGFLGIHPSHFQTFYCRQQLRSGEKKSLDLVKEIKTAKYSLAKVLLAGTRYFDSWLALSFHLFISSAALPLSLTEGCSEAGNYWYVLLCARLFGDRLLTCFCCTDLPLFPWLRSASLCLSLTDVFLPVRRLTRFL